jgi:hypothetical protein
VAGIPGDRAAVTATAPGHLPASQDIDVDGHAATLHIALATAGEIHGAVRAPGGSPVPGIVVTVASTAGDIIDATVTGRDGGYRLTGLGPGDHVVVAAGHEPTTVPVRVGPGGAATVTLSLGAP